MDFGDTPMTSETSIYHDQSQSPSGNFTVRYWTWPVSSLISLFKMVIVHSHVSLPEGINQINGKFRILKWRNVFTYHMFGHMNCGDIPWNLGLKLIGLKKMLGTSNESDPSVEPPTTRQGAASAAEVARCCDLARNPGRWWSQIQYCICGWMDG